MKYIVCAVSAVLIVLGLVLFGNLKSDVNEEYLRIHIRANSNSDADQGVKYEIKDRVVDALVPILASVATKEEAEEKMKTNFALIENVCNQLLKEKGFNYKAKAKLKTEEFPTRSYNNLTLEAGFYDALIIELGSAEGDNWWCVVYPPFCFTTSTKPENYEYTSLIWGMLKNVFN